MKVKTGLEGLLLLFLPRLLLHLLHPFSLSLSLCLLDILQPVCRSMHRSVRCMRDRCGARSGPGLLVHPLSSPASGFSVHYVGFPSQYQRIVRDASSDSLASLSIENESLLSYIDELSSCTRGSVMSRTEQTAFLILRCI